MNTIVVALIILCCACSASLAQIRIHEVSPANASLMDEDSDLSDWIELYNAGTAPVRMKDYRIGDKGDIARAWRLPDTTLEPGRYILVRASGKDKVGSGLLCIEGTGAGINPWNTWDAFRYLYRPVHGDFDFSMRLHAFRQNAAFARVGIMLTDEVRPDNLHSALFFTGRNVYTSSQRSVRMKAPEWQKEYSDVSADCPYVWLRLQRRKDSVFIYASRFGVDWQAIDSSKFDAAGDGGYVGIAIASSDMQKSVRAIVTDLAFNGKSIAFFDLATAEVGTEVAGAHYESRELHTHFTLNSESETLYVWNADGLLLDLMSYTMAGTNVSFGRAGNQTPVLCLDHATPEAANATGLPLLQAELFVDPPGGIIAQGTVVRCTTESPDVHIRYTVDGSVPTPASPLYQTPFFVDSTVVLRVRLFRDGYYPGMAMTYTYLVDEPFTALPIFSIASDPSLFWSDSVGIMSMGPDASPIPPYIGANFWKDWEIPCAMQMFSNGEEALSMDAGVKVHGHYGSRPLAQKSLRLAFRDRYGDGAINYKLFPEKSLTHFENIILRNGGNDWLSAFLRDPLMSVIGSRVGMDVQAYRPVQAYINGLYWGMYHLRERQDEHYIAQQYDVEPEAVDMLENNTTVMSGSPYGYIHFIDSLSERDMSSEEDIEFLQRHIDIDNFIAYNCLQIFAGNADWPGNNVRLWRLNTPEGRWRWLLFDLDLGWGSAQDYHANTLAYALSPEPTSRLNPQWATLLLRKVVAAEPLRNRFINRFADLLNSALATPAIVSLIDSLAGDIEPDIARHRARWLASVPNWETKVQKVRDFATYRPAVARRHVVEQFGLSGTVTVHLSVQGQGYIRMNTLMPESLPFEGIYFRDVPVPVVAIAAPGYRFAGWSDAALPDTSAVDITFQTDNYTLVARFEATTSSTVAVVINEIMYKPSDDRDSKDWIELFNGSAKAVDVSGWTLKDENDDDEDDDDDDHAFRLPAGTVLPAGGYLVLCNSVEAFTTAYGSVPVLVVGDVDFGFGTPSDQVRLFDASGALVDSVEYSTTSPWPSDANGTGKSIELLHPDLDNTLGVNWRSSVDSGTPGAPNGTGTAVGNIVERVPFTLSCFPNPVAAGADVSVYCEISEPGRIVFSITDVSGKHVSTLPQSEYNVGEHHIRLSTRGLAPGQYFLRAKLSTAVRESIQLITFIVQ